MPRKGLDEPGNFNRTCGFMGLCRQRHKPGHPAGEIEGSWAIDKESGEVLSHIHIPTAQEGVECVPCLAGREKGAVFGHFSGKCGFGFW